MFDNYYSFNLIGRDKAAGDDNLLRFVERYNFRTNKNRYIVEIERYPKHIYCLKFYLGRDKGREYRCNLLSGEYLCSRVVATCARILLHVLSRDRLASFGFVGVPTKTEAGVLMEAASKTKRYRIYKGVAENLLGSMTFHHVFDEGNSLYLMVNSGNTSLDEIEEEARAIIKAAYDSTFDCNFAAA